MTYDLDKVYEPEQLDQLAKDLVVARREPLTPLEDASLRRWKRQGVSARIRRLPDARLTCWPADLPSSAIPSHFRGQRMSGREVMAALRGEVDVYGVSCRAYFDKTDKDLLRAAALMDTVRPGERSVFDRAADSIERDSYLVIQCSDKEELRQIIGRFRDAGVVHVTLDDLRMGQPVRV
jgi:hypothetical protein